MPSLESLPLQPGNWAHLNDYLTQITTGGSLPVFPEDYGAVGDGVTDDTTAMLTAVATGRDVALKDGKTYLVRQVLNFNTNGQIFDGRGSTLKRAAQAITTTTTTITSGVTSAITVADASSFRVSDQIVVEQGGSFDTIQRTILTIVGNVITISGTFGVSLSGTTNVRTGWNQIAVNGSDCRFTGLILDGNSSNWSWGRWQHSAAINCGQTGLRVEVDHCRIVNQYGDGFSPTSAGWTFFANDVEQIKGRGLVFGGNTGIALNLDTRVLNNRFVSCNLDTAVAGNDGVASIDFSLGGPCTLISGNYIDGGVDGIGPIRNDPNAEVTITDNEMWNLTGVGISGVGGDTNPERDVVIRGNRLYGCGITINKVGLTAVPARWSIVGNILVGGSITCQTLTDSVINDNIVSYTALAAPLNLVTTARTTGGTFAAGTYFYKVTATNTAGETTGSVEASAVVVLNGSVVLNWDVVPGASGYKVYRSATTGTENVSPALVGTVTSATTPTYTDTGAAASAGAVPAANNTNSITAACVALGLTGGSVSNVVMGGNRLAGGLYGVNVKTACSNLLVTGNVITGFYNNAIFQNVNTNTKCVYSGNLIAADATGQASSCFAILCMGNDQVLNNVIDVASGPSGSAGLSAQSSTGGMVIKGNTIYGGGWTAVAINGTVTNAQFEGNTLDKAPTDNGVTTKKFNNTYTAAGAISGRATLVAGTVTISTAEVIASDRILLTCVLVGGTQGILSVGTITAGTSFVINSSNAADTSTVYWRIDH